MLKYQEENYTKKEMIKIKILIFSNIIQNKNIKKLIKNINNKNNNWLKFFYELFNSLFNFPYSNNYFLIK